MFVPLYDTNPTRFVRAPTVTWSIILACTGMHLLVGSALVLGPDTARAAAYVLGLVPAVFNDLVNLPPQWRFLPETAGPLTYMWLHADWMHLLGNMLFLWVFGDNVEDAMGHLRFLLFYLICGIAGGLAYALLGPQASQAPLVGASGAVSGVVVAYLVLYPRVRVWILLFWRLPLPVSALWCLGGWVLFQFWQLLFAGAESHVAWLAHVGGLSAGAVLVILLKRRDVPLFGG